MQVMSPRKSTFSSAPAEDDVRKPKTLNATGSLAKGLRIVQALTDAPTPMSLAQIGDAASLDASTVHRLLQVLIEEGWVVKIERSREYAAGPNAIAHMAPWHPVNAFRREAYHLLEKLHNELGETVALILFVGTDRIVLEAIHGRLSMSPYYDVRLRSPLHGSASGKLLLAALSNEERTALLGSEPYPAVTPNCPTDPEALRKQITEAAARGYVVSRDEAFSGLVAYGSPIVFRNRTPGCVVITASSTTVPAQADAEYGGAIRNTAMLVASTVPAVRSLIHFLFG